MNKNSIIEKDGVITANLSHGKWQVQLENDMLVTCTISGKLNKNKITVMPGDRVKVELSIYGLDKGRISYRYRK